MWIESHQSLGRHPKLLKLAGLLRIHRAQSIGHLHFLWWWALDYTPTGDVSALTSAEIATASEWPGDVPLYHKALQESGWIDPDGMLHDWYDYAGKLIEMREADRKRKRSARKALSSVKRPADIRRTSGGTPAVQYLTKPDQTEPNQKREAAPARVLDPPSVKQIRDYAGIRGFPINAEKFLAHFTAVGWIDAQGRKIVDWTAAVDKWHLDQLDRDQEKISRDKARGGPNGRISGTFAPTRPGKYD